METRQALHTSRKDRKHILANMFFKPTRYDLVSIQGVTTIRRPGLIYAYDIWEKVCLNVFENYMLRDT